MSCGVLGCKTVCVVCGMSRVDSGVRYGIFNFPFMTGLDGLWLNTIS